MVRLLFFFMGVSLLFSSCYCECCSCEGASGEIDLSVLDMDNKPIAGVTVGPYIYPNGVNGRNFFKQTYQTDAKGQIHISYVFPVDSYTDWSLSAADINDYRALYFIESPYRYTPEHKKITHIDTIRMDALKLITVRFKSNKTDAQNLFLRVYSEGYSRDTRIRRDFYWNSPKLSGTSPIDTTIQVSAYGKVELFISAGLQFKNTTLNVNQTKKLANYARRDTVFLFEF